MLTITIASLSGGQGKTTITLMLAQLLALQGIATLAIDADPQHNLTTYLELEPEPSQPTMLEFLKNSVAIEETIYHSERLEKLFLIPADNQLDLANDYLSSSGVGATLLKTRLEEVEEIFEICLIDSPPQRSQICLSAIGAADYVIIPAEANIKGYTSLVRTLDLLNSMRHIKASNAELLGVIPFRDRWFGLNRSSESKGAIAAMKAELNESLILPTIRESERFKQAINAKKTLSELGYRDLEYPFEILAEQISKKIKQTTKS